MKTSLEPGKYVVAVSGGVDSMVLLDVLRGRPGLGLVVAHFEHGIREDSDLDRQLVQKVAESHGLPFVFERGNLGRAASEAQAREARYAFLRRVKNQTGARAILTAHHQDDVLETAILNLLRGTGRKGLSALRSHDDIIRPLLHKTKQEILAYARVQKLRWREDSTNANQAYLRNYIRLNIVPRLGAANKKTLLKYIAEMGKSNVEIDRLVEQALLQSEVASLDRQWFTALPHVVAREIMASWLRHNDARDLDRPLIEHLVVAAKVAAPGKLADINQKIILRIGKDQLQIVPRPPSPKRITSV